MTRIDQVLEYVGMSGRAKDAVQTYSLGMKQRLGIAAAMLSDPDLLLLDEPANGLDPGGMVAMRETLRYFTEELGKTVVISSHLLHEVEQLADVVGIIDRGKLHPRGRPGHSCSRTRDACGARRRRRTWPRAGEILRHVRAGSTALRRRFRATRPAGSRSNVPADRATEINRALAEAGIYASGLEPGSDLESVFLELTGTAARPRRPTSRPRRPLPPPS